jgi:hypothetical protein
MEDFPPFLLVGGGGVNGGGGWMLLMECWGISWGALIGDSIRN